MAKKVVNCPYCEKPGVLKTRESTFRREDKFVTIQVKHYECPSGCEMPRGQGDPPLPEKYRVFGWEDMELMKENSEQAKLAWLAKYGEEMPKPRRIRRKQP